MNFKYGMNKKLHTFRKAGEQMNIQNLLEQKEYDFIKNNKRLGRNIILLGMGGSYAYGTNNEYSDIDVRGVTMNLKSDLLGLTEFEQYVDDKTDTVIYSFNKIVKLLLECNPNTCEILGMREDHYLYLSEMGKELRNNKSLFLSKRAAKSFGGYAGAQLRRLQNALARDTFPQAEKERHIFNSVKNALEDFQRKYDTFEKGNICLYIDQSEHPELETEIFVDASYKHYPLRDYEKMWSTMHNVVKEYDKIGKRNHKKDDNHLNKHAMHLIRLFMMAIDILEKGEVITYREKELDLLLKIRNGGFRTENGLFSAEFYEILSDYETRLEYATEHSVLPDNPDMEKVEDFMEQMNERVISGEII